MAVVLPLGRMRVLPYCQHSPKEETSELQWPQLQRWAHWQRYREVHPQQKPTCPHPPHPTCPILARLQISFRCCHSSAELAPRLASPNCGWRLQRGLGLFWRELRATGHVLRVAEHVQMLVIAAS